MSRASFNEGWLLTTHSDPIPVKTCMKRIHSRNQKYHEHRVALPECCAAYMFSLTEYKTFFQVPDKCTQNEVSSMCTFIN